MMYVGNIFSGIFGKDTLTMNLMGVSLNLLFAF